MGEVWKARDQKLGREVAIKTLPEEFAKDEERLARFEREAKLLALLNHPNIAAIYGLEEHNGTRFLVLELVEGDTLADRLKRGAIRVEESLKLTLQIAEALEAAHEKGGHPPGSQACQHQGHTRWQDQSPGFRIGEGICRHSGGR